MSTSILETVLLSRSIVLLVNVCDDVSWTISLFVMLAIFVAVAAFPVVEPELPLTLPVTSPVKLPVTSPVKSPVTSPVTLPVTLPVKLPVTLPVIVPVTVIPVLVVCNFVEPWCCKFIFVFAVISSCPFIAFIWPLVVLDNILKSKSSLNGPFKSIIAPDGPPSSTCAKPLAASNSILPVKLPVVASKLPITKPAFV